ncbi:hypothetical protein F53441_11612 [Fusarium austroafricanum]|uniref:Uncharacterized protein n=1 Tax=Fusarium austroafricanum TaxID=2364996 RepID=A0A8H4NRY2_9HYPO|nr:hypothetical protein F53441_11612 [Fusarium austroafricanum]
MFKFKAWNDFKAKYPEESRRRDGWIEDDFQWMIKFLPLQALMDICHDEDHDVVLSCGGSLRMQRFLSCDPGLKKVKAITIMVQNVPGYRSISPRDVWKQPEFLKRWVDLNAVPKLNQIPEAVAEEAFYVLRDTNYVRLWIMFFNENNSLRSVRLQRLLGIGNQRGMTNDDSGAEMKWKDTTRAAVKAEAKAEANVDRSKWRRLFCSSWKTIIWESLAYE